MVSMYGYDLRLIITALKHSQGFNTASKLSKILKKMSSKKIALVIKNKVPPGIVEIKVKTNKNGDRVNEYRLITQDLPPCFFDIENIDLEMIRNA